MRNRTDPTPVAVAEPVPPVSYTRRFASNLTYGLAGAAARFSVGMFLVGYVIRRLGPDHWGLIVVGMTTASILGLIQLGASAGVAKKLNTAMTRQETHLFSQYFTASILLSVSLAGVMMAGLGMLLTVGWSWLKIGPSLAVEGRWVLGAIGLSVVATALSLPFLACMQAVHRIDVHAKVHTAGLILRACAVVVAFEWSKPRAATYAIIIMAVAILMLAAAALWVRHRVSAARMVRGGIDRGVLCDLTAFNLLTLINSVTYVVFMQTPTLVLQRCSGLATAGLYGIGLQLNLLVRGFLVPATNALSPVAISLESREKGEQMTTLFRLSSKAFAGIALMLWVGFIFLGEPFLTLWLGREEPELVAALPWLIGASAVGVAAMPSAVFLVAQERLRIPGVVGLVLAAVMIVAMVNVAGRDADHLLVPMSQLLMLFFTAYQCVRVWVAGRGVRLTPRELLVDLVLRPAIPAAGGAAVLLVNDMIGEVKGFVHLGVAAMGALLVFGLFAYVGLFSRDERALVRERIRSLQHNRRRPQAR